MPINEEFYTRADKLEVELASAREVLAAYDVLVDSLRAEIAQLRAELSVDTSYFADHPLEV